MEKTYRRKEMKSLVISIHTLTSACTAQLLHHVALDSSFSPPSHLCSLILSVLLLQTHCLNLPVGEE